jgi:hypothetical protein
MRPHLAAHPRLAVLATALIAVFGAIATVVGAPPVAPASLVAAAQPDPPVAPR